jgi:hypothetical protein
MFDGLGDAIAGAIIFCGVIAFIIGAVIGIAVALLF